MADVNAVNAAGSITSLYNPGGNDLGKDEFLKLFITQLKNQDPLEPMDNTQFIAQLSEFSQLEQLWNVNENLSANGNLTQSVHNALMTNMIGKQVKVASNTIRWTGDSVPEIQYQMPQSGDVAIEIVNETGTLVYRNQMTQEAGAQAFEWKGLDANGNELPWGDYTAYVTHTDMTGQNTILSPYLDGRITGLQFENGNPVLYMGNQAINSSDILAVYENKD